MKTRFERGERRTSCWQALALLLMVTPVPASADALTDAQSAYERHDYVAAFTQFRALAASGVIQAQHKLGVMYALGEGVAPDWVEADRWVIIAASGGHQEAIEDRVKLESRLKPAARERARRLAEQWLKRANSPSVEALNAAKSALERSDYSTAAALWQPLAEAGNAEAMAGLAGLYENAYGYRQDFERARDWYRRAAEQGDPADQARYGEFLYRRTAELNGTMAEATKWLQLAATGGDPDAAFMLFLLYENGHAGARSPRDADKWLRTAVDRGHWGATVNLADRYERGDGLPRSAFEAGKWYAVAAIRDPAHDGIERIHRALARLGVELDDHGKGGTLTFAINWRPYDGSALVPVAPSSGDPADKTAPGVDAGTRQPLPQASSAAGTLPPGTVFADSFPDGAPAPRMVVIPAGQFEMGSKDDDPEAEPSEHPRHTVRIARPFAVAATEITVSEFERFIAHADDATRRHLESGTFSTSMVWNAEKRSMEMREGLGWRYDYVGQRKEGNRPVTNVAWVTALNYAKWLASETHQPYRLLTEAEFEYVARAGTDTRYPWGDGMPPAKTLNVAGELDTSDKTGIFGTYFAGYGDGFLGDAPVGSFAPNPFGLYDVLGNVAEWVQDCYYDSYADAPADGSASVEDDLCRRNVGGRGRVIRGGSFLNGPRRTRPAARMQGAYWFEWNPMLGFRVARDLAPVRQP